MIGVCFRDIGRVAVEQVCDPVIKESSDAIVRVELAGLCGSDLHPFFGREKGIDPGTVMGHEFVGEVIAIGDSVRSIGVGDRVCAPFTTNCGECFYCKCGLTARCTVGQLFGWREGGIGLHGGQASIVRVPLADGTLMRIPAGMCDETALLLGDNLSTGYFAAEGVDIRDDGVYVVIGCGTVGLMAIVSAFQLGATTVLAIDPEPSRLSIASSLGAKTFAESGDLLRELRERTDQRGADGVMELVGLPDAQQLAYQAIRPGGTMSVIGCHCAPHFAFSPSDAYNKNLTYRTGRCSARHYMSELADKLVAKSMDLSWCITHRFHVNDAVRAYDVFAGRKEGCVKAVFSF